MNCNCKDWSENIEIVNAPIMLAAARSGGRVQYTGKRFTHCPWCGKQLEESEAHSVSDRGYSHATSVSPQTSPEASPATTGKGPMELDAILDQMEQRANAATPGPWITIPYSNSRNLSVCSVGKGIANICDININRTEGTENTTFIAAARSNIPSLIEVVKMALPFVPDTVQLAMSQRLAEGK